MTKGEERDIMYELSERRRRGERARAVIISQKVIEVQRFARKSLRDAEGERK